jgi:hypothetical protein
LRVVSVFAHSVSWSTLTLTRAFSDILAFSSRVRWASSLCIRSCSQAMSCSYISSTAAAVVGVVAKGGGDGLHT